MPMVGRIVRRLGQRGRFSGGGTQHAVHMHGLRDDFSGG